MKKEILRTLQTAQKPVKRAELLFHLRGLGWDTTDRAMRKEIERMIIDDKELIQSSEKGYSLIQTEPQMIEALTYLFAKARAISIRKNCLVRNWKDKQELKELSTIIQPTLF